MRKDILIDDTNDLVVEKGDFVIGDSDNQHVSLIVEAVKGEIRSSPELGFGIKRYLKKTGRSREEFLRNLKVELEKDGYDDLEVTIDQEGKISIQ